MNILWLGEPACHHIPTVGGKVANLSRLSADHRVPPGFCLTTAAFDLWADDVESSLKISVSTSSSWPGSPSAG